MASGTLARHLATPEAFLARWSRWMVRHRRLVVLFCLLGTALIAVLAGSGSYSGDFVPGGEARRTERLVATELGQPGRSSFVVVLTTDDPARLPAAADRALAPLRTDPRVAQVADTGTGSGGSADGRTAYATVFLRDDVRQAALDYPDLRAKIRADGLTVQGTGDVAVTSDLGKSLDADLAKAELISLPLALLLLLLVFGTVVAAVVPLLVGVLAVVGGTAVAAALSHVVGMSELTTSVVTLLGLGLAIDYSLFIVSRFRAELGAGRSTEDAIAVALATAGRTVLVSGLTVIAGLSGLLLFRGSFLPGMGLGAAGAVLLSVVFALTFLPALLGMLGTRIERLGVVRRRPGRSERFWHRLAGGVLRRPWLLVPVVAVLVVLGLPFLHARLDTNDLDQLPLGTEARAGAEVLAARFPEFRTADVQVVVRSGGDPESATQPTRTIGTLPRVTEVERAAVHPDFVLLDVRTDIPAGDPAARGLVTAIRALSTPDTTVLVTGQAATEADLSALISRWTPWALLLVVVLIYLVLLFALRSILLPAKAVVLTLLSITASFGALVWVFQEGHLSQPAQGGLDPAVPVLLFSLAFGLSMDYEVLLLSRMQEAYRGGADNITAVEEGLVRSGPLVTGAAAIMVAVFGSFAVGQVVLVKAIGLGLALAVAADATLVRCVAVPALMRLFGRANWWAPGPLRRAEKSR